MGAAGFGLILLDAAVEDDGTVAVAEVGEASSAKGTRTTGTWTVADDGSSLGTTMVPEAGSTVTFRGREDRFGSGTSVLMLFQTHEHG